MNRMESEVLRMIRSEKFYTFSDKSQAAIIGGAAIRLVEGLAEESQGDIDMILWSLKRSEND